MTVATLTATNLLGDHTLRVTEKTPKRSTIVHEFTLASRYTEGQAHADACNSFDLEDVNVTLTRATENDKWNVTAQYGFAGDAETAWRFAQGAFLGTSDYHQLMWELGAPVHS